jgi:hypothetical protein
MIAQLSSMRDVVTESVRSSAEAGDRWDIDEARRKSRRWHKAESCVPIEPYELRAVPLNLATGP